ncbi:MAG: Tetratricopeptide repeat protein [Syntrophorhabdus sp. PtaU1.Bin002]|nr:MAG: Tetratricopeptide repeat protein [Syntrophorhabdus sp. PtaU1.Bin002]
MNKSSLRINIKNLTVEAGDGYSYPLTKRFLYLYVYLAYQRTVESSGDGGFATLEQIRHLPFWEKNSFESVGKQIRRHMMEMEQTGRNVIVAVQRIKGPFGLNIEPENITFDASRESIGRFLGLDRLAVLRSEKSESNLYRYVEEITQGDIYFNEGLLKKSLQSFRAAMNQGETLDQKITALLRIGRIHERQGDYGEARDTYESMEKLIKKDSVYDYYGLANLYNNLAFLYYRENDFELSEKTYFKAFDLIRGRTHNQLLGRIYNGLAVIYEATERFIEALGFFKNSLVLECVESDFSGISSVYFNIGNVYRRMGDQIIKSGGGAMKNIPAEAKGYYLQAITWGMKCVNLCDRTGVGDETSQDRTLISYCYYRLKNFKKAMAYADEANRMAVTSGNKRDLALSYELMGKILKVTGGDQAKANEYLQKSLEYYHMIGHKARVERLMSQFNLTLKS